MIGGVKIEAASYGPRSDAAPTLVLHEGLGCVGMRRDFPRRLAQRTGYGVLVSSRPGYGRSDPVPLPRSLDYMYQEALEVLPAILDQAEIRKAILIGHKAVARWRRGCRLSAAAMTERPLRRLRPTEEPLRCRVAPQSVHTAFGRGPHG
jgi:hypothetical protein